MLKELTGENTSELSFKLSEKDIFLAELKRKEEKEAKINEILDTDFLDRFTQIDHTFSSAFILLNEINNRQRN